MSNGVVLEEIDRAILIRFNRPEIRNPLSIQVLEELLRILDDIENRVGLDRVILTGVGNVFASGADLREIAKVDGAGAPEFGKRGQELMTRISKMRVVTIAAVNGICFGGALDLALACRHRIASAEARFCHPGANLGIMTGWGGTQRLPRLIGEARALEMFFTARQFEAEESLRIGLVDELVDDAVNGALELLT